MKINFENLEFGKVVVIPKRFVDECIYKLNSEYIRLYLYLVNHIDEDFSEEQIAADLNLLIYDVKNGLLKLKDDGLITFNDVKSKEEKNVENKLVENDENKYENYFVSSTNSDEEKNEDDVKNNIDIYSFDISDYDHDDFKDVLEGIEFLISKKIENEIDIRKLIAVYKICNDDSKDAYRFVELCIDRGIKTINAIFTKAKKFYNSNIKDIDGFFADQEYIRTIAKTLGIDNCKEGTIDYKQIHEWLIKYPFPIEVIVEACNRTRLNTGKSGLSYTQSILDDWNKDNVRSIEDIYELDKKFKNKNVKTNKVDTKKNKFNNYDQRDNDLNSDLLKLYKEKHN